MAVKIKITQGKSDSGVADRSKTSAIIKIYDKGVLIKTLKASIAGHLVFSPEEGYHNHVEVEEVP